MNNMGVLFPATRRVSMDLDGDPNISFVTRLAFGTLESVVPWILPMQDYIVVETAKLVNFSLFYLWCLSLLISQ